MQQVQSLVTAYLVVLKKVYIVFIHKIDGPGMVKFDTYVGKRAEVHCTGLGKVLLAFSNEQMIRDCLSVGSFAKYTEATITSPANFRKDLIRVKQKGYSIDDEEEEAGVRCVAAPVFNPLGELVTAVSVTGTTAQISSDSFDKMAATVKEGAARISRALKEL